MNNWISFSTFVQNQENEDESQAICTVVKTNLTSYNFLERAVLADEQKNQKSKIYIIVEDRKKKTSVKCLSNFVKVKAYTLVQPTLKRRTYKWWF